MSFINTLRKPETIPEKLLAFGKRNIFVWMSFLIPLALMFTAYAMMDISPFGKATKQLLVTDLWHQYYPFLVDLQDKLKNGHSLFWTWSVGGGANYFSLMSYYLASPMNFLSVFIPADFLREFLALSVAVKISLAGSFMAYFLKSVYRRNDASLVMFGISFSFCAFFMGYYWNTIWLDTVCITPLVALGAVKLLMENKFRLYTVMLALSLLTNYYMAFFSCIFVMLIFISYTIIRWQSFKVLGVNILKFVLFTILGIGLSAFFLLPTVMALQNTHASSGVFPKEFAVNIGGSNDFLGVLKGLKSVTGNLVNFTVTNNKEIDGMPNIACGAVPLFFAFLSLTSREIKLREKLVSVGLILFMFLSFIIRQLDYIWHGFHFPNMIYYRFSYLVSFVIIVMGFRAFMYIKKTNFIDALIATALSFFVWAMEFDYSGTKNPSCDGPYDQGVVNMFVAKINGNDHNKRPERVEWIEPTLIAAAVLLALIGIIVLLYSKRVIPRQSLAVGLLVIVVAQSGYTAYFGVNVSGSTIAYDKDGNLTYPEKGNYVEEVVDGMNERESDNKGLWRAEVARQSTLNDGAVNRYRGLSMFNSMLNEKMTIFYENIGLAGHQAGNRFVYNEGTPVLHLFTNLKYLISRGDTIIGTYSSRKDAVDQSEKSKLVNYMKQTEVSSGAVKLYENTRYLDTGFIVDKALTDWEVNLKENSYDPVEKQSEFFRLATGIEDPVFKKVNIAETKPSAGSTQWNYTAPISGLYVLYADVGNDRKITIAAADENGNPGNTVKTYEGRYRNINPVGYFTKGETITLTVDSGAVSTNRVFFYALDPDVFEKGYNKLKENVMTTTYFNDGGRLEGTIDANRDGLFYTSIPYEKGWQAYVDGEEVEITPVGDALVAFPITKGKHDIVLKYKPNGFVPGLIISIICMLAFAAYCVFTYILRKKLLPDFAKDELYKEEKKDDQPSVKDYPDTGKNNKKHKGKKAAVRKKQ